MTQRIELMLMDPAKRQEEPRKIAEFQASVVPGPGEHLTWNNRAFAVLGRAFALEERTKASLTEVGAGEASLGVHRSLALDVALVVQQVGGPPMLLATPAGLKI